MSRDRKSLAVVLGLVACRLIGAGSALAISAGDHVTTAAISTSDCSTPIPKTEFRASDDRAYLWLSILGTTVGDTVEWHWFAPGNSPYATSHYDVTEPGDGCAWGWIDITGQAAATKPGQWRVDVYLNGTFAFSNTFTISGEPPPPSLRGGAASLEFSVNDQILVPWGYAELSYRLRSFRPGLRVDLYLAMLLAGEGDQCIGPELVFTSALPAFATDLELANAQSVVFAGTLPDRVDRVALTLYGVLVPTGKSPADPANWISNVAALDLALGTLSSRQTEVIVAQGNPGAFIIDFDRRRHRRTETWIYQHGTSGLEFQFINGAAVGAPQDGERNGGTPGSTTRYDPGRFSPATTPREIRELLGDPDHVVKGSVAGRVAWIFDSARLTVTLEAGVIQRIEVY